MHNAITLERPPTITSEIVRLTPSDARRLLDLNTHNRRRSEADVLKYAAEMEAGRWQTNGEAIKISSSNVLLDGQTRLEALTLLDESTSIEFLIIRGLPAETQSTMDQGRKRSAVDQLNLANVSADKSVAAAVRTYLIMDYDLLFHDNKRVDASITTTKIVEWAQDNPSTLELIRRGSAYRKIKARPGLVFAIYARIAEAHSVDSADEFFQGVLDGLELSAGSPIVALRNRLDQIAASIGGRVSDRDVIGYFIASFNHWVMGNTIKRLQRPHGASWNRANFPQICGPGAVS